MDRRRLQCSMCYHFTYSTTRLIRHYVRNHQHDPRFFVTCCADGCGATYRKWQSFKKHIYRCHRDQYNDDAFQPQEDDGPGNDIENGIVEEIPLGDHDVELEMGRVDLLRWHAAKFLLHVRDACRTSQKAMEMVMEGTQHLLQEYISLVKDEIEETGDPAHDVVPIARVLEILNDTLPVSMCFSQVNTKYKLDKFMIEHLGMIYPQEIELGRELVWKRKPVADLVEVVRKGYCIPFLPSLKRLLLNSQVRFCVENPKPYQGVMKTVLHGQYYRSHEVFASNNPALAVILFYDELEIVNPLGSRTHKLGMFYWTLANIYPEFRSTLSAVNLLAVAKYSYIKKYGIDHILNNFIEDINTLQTEGINVQCDNTVKTFKGSLLMVTGDTPASALVGGFKQSVSASKPCRRCMTDEERWKQYFAESDFVLRTKAMHEEHTAAVSEPNLRAFVRNFWKQYYGVNRRTPLMNIPGFDVTRCLVQDIMHILSEGVLKVAVLAFLNFCLQQGFFNLDTLNSRIGRFDYGHLARDKPSEILVPHLENGLRQSAAQMVCLSYVLPFLIADLLTGDDGAEHGDAHEKLVHHARLLQIVNICFAYEVTEDDAHYLRVLIQVWLAQYKRHYPDTMVPKFHFLIHVVGQMIDFGPLRQQFCMRFEAANQWYKSIIRTVRSFKNMPFTLAYRQETYRCQQLATFPGSPSVRFLYSGHSIKSGHMQECRNLPPLIQVQLQEQMQGVDLNTCQVMVSQEVSVHGVTFRPQSVILVECGEEDWPIFGKITDIIVHNRDIYFAVVPFSTDFYQQSLNAYRINMSETRDQQVIHVSNLLHPHALSVFTFQHSKYIVLFNHTRGEFID